MKKTKVVSLKLQLTTETIRKLDQDQLLAVNGGGRLSSTFMAAWSSKTQSCPG